MTADRHRRAMLLLFVAAGIWGASFVVTKGLLSSLSPFTIMLVRFALAWVFLYPTARARGYRLADSGRRDLVMFGLTGMFLHLGLEVGGLQFTTASNAALIVAATPAVTALMSWFMERGRPSSRQMTGIALSVVGVLAVTGAAWKSGAAQLIGNGLVLAGVFMWGIYTVQGRRLGSKTSALVSTEGALGAAIAMTLPAALVELALGPSVQITVAMVAGLLYLGIGASALAFLAWNAALTHVEPATAAPYVNLVPVVGLALAAALGDAPTAIQIAGGAVVGAGVWIASSADSAQRRGERARKFAQASIS